MKISGGRVENNVVVGNTYNKYGSGNLIVRMFMEKFTSSLTELIKLVDPSSIHEVGCGEGYWTLRWNHEGINTRGSDFSDTVIQLAKSNARDQGVSTDIFTACSIYDQDGSTGLAELTVCCEVLEHLEDPDMAMGVLQKIVSPYLLISVPREPLWRILNVARGSYIKSLGNTPGHIQHWSKDSFIKMVSSYFQVIEIRNPIPWTMLLCRKM